MPRTLRQPPPTSSVARLLDTGAATRAISRQQDSPAALPPGDSSTRSDGETANGSEVAYPSAESAPRRIKREILLCPETDETLDELVRFLRLGTRARVTTSHLVRALLRAVAPDLQSIRLRAAQLGPRRLPSNAPGSEAARRQFEELIAAILIRVPAGE